MYLGRKPTPLSVSSGQFLYGQSRSKEVLSVAIKMGVSRSFNDVRRSRALLAAYNVDNSKNDEIPIPSTFTKNAIVFRSVDNTDFDDKNSVAGTAKSEHVTSVVLYQEINAKPEPKPRASSLGQRKSNLKLPKKLPCQEVPDFPKPPYKPSVPPTFKIKIERNRLLIHALLYAKQKLMNF